MAQKAKAERLDEAVAELEVYDTPFSDGTLDDEVEHVRVCLYGDPGSGKTTSAAHLAHLGAVAFFPVEPGLKKTALAKLGVPLKNIHPVADTTYDGFMDAYRRLHSALYDRPGAVSGVVFDSATEMVSRSVAAIRREKYATNVSKAHARGEEYNKSRFFTDIAYYGEMTGEFRDILEHFIDLPCHLVITAHARRDEDEDGEVSYGPAVTPAVQNDIVGYMDIIMRVVELKPYDDGSKNIVGITSNGGKYRVKDRFGVLPAAMASPTMDRIVAYVNGELEANTDPVQKKYRNWRIDQAAEAATKGN